MKPNAQTIARVIISLVALAVVVIALRGVDVTAAWDILRAANPWLLLLVLAAQALGMTLRLVRWREMLRPRQTLSIRSLLSPLLIYYMVGNLTVTGVGIVPRVYLVQRRAGIDAGFLVGTLILEYLLDATVVLLGAVVMPLVVTVPPLLHQMQILLAFPLVIVLVVNLALWHREFFQARIAERRDKWDGLVSRLPWNVGPHLTGIGDGLATSLAGVSGVRIVLSTITIWVVEVVVFWLLMLSLNTDLGFLAAAALTIYTYIATGVPAAPGHIGTLEIMTVSLIPALGGSQALALAYAVLLRIFFVGPTTLAGLVLAFRERESLGDLFSGSGRTGGDSRRNDGHDRGIGADNKGIPGAGGGTRSEPGELGSQGGPVVKVDEALPGLASPEARAARCQGSGTLCRVTAPVTSRRLPEGRTGLPGASGTAHVPVRRGRMT